MNLDTNYMGLKLKNPIIVGSSGLTKSVTKIQECEEAGAGAVIVKSLFEEVLAKEDWELEKSIPMHPESYDYIRSQIQMQYGPKDYCELINNAKKKVKIPVIGSINCISDKWWPNFARQIEDAGADAIELNVFSIPVNISKDSGTIEEEYYNILETIKKKIKIPVAMKICYYFTSLPHFVKKLETNGLNGIVIFNRFTEPDIDIDKLNIKTSFSFSSEENILPLIRWTGILAGQINCDISATTGIHTSAGVIKLLLAGASTVQPVSVLYQRGIKYLKTMLDGVSQWMVEHNYQSVDQFKGKLVFNEENFSDIYLRAQFMEKIKGIE